MTLFASFLNPVSIGGPAVAFHVKSMRVAQFIKLDGRTSKWRIFELSIILSNLEDQKGL